MFTLFCLILGNEVPGEENATAAKNDVEEDAQFDEFDSMGDMGMDMPTTFSDSVDDEDDTTDTSKGKESFDFEEEFRKAEAAYAKSKEDVESAFADSRAEAPSENAHTAESSSAKPPRTPHKVKKHHEKNNAGSVYGDSPTSPRNFKKDHDKYELDGRSTRTEATKKKSRKKKEEKIKNNREKFSSRNARKVPGGENGETKNKARKVQVGLDADFIGPTDPDPNL